ncbi:MAG TPA: Flp family type IVb pilin [Bacillota bacterium]|nr:Flp family type IVb pilin [Bacillota bacterium]
MTTFFKRLWKDEAGQGLSEYGLIIGLVSIALVGILMVMTGALDTIFQAIADVLNNAASGVE